MSKKALSTLILDFAEVSMNLQLKDFARFSPSNLLYQHSVLPSSNCGYKITLSLDFSLALEIALVAHYDHGEVILVLHPEDLLLESRNFLEALAGCDRVDQ